MNIEFTSVNRSSASPTKNSTTPSQNSSVNFSDELSDMKKTSDSKSEIVDTPVEEQESAKEISEVDAIVEEQESAEELPEIDTTVEGQEFVDEISENDTSLEEQKSAKGISEGDTAVNKQESVDEISEADVAPIEQEDESNSADDVIANEVDKMTNELSQILQEFNQSDEEKDDSLKLTKNSDDKTEKGDNLINNDLNIQDNKDILPQMNPNMNFSGDGQPFSSFMSNDDSQNNGGLSSSAQELAEESAILSTMAENIALANKNAIEQQNNEKTVTNEEGIKKVDTTTNTTLETVVKFDSIVMNEGDVEVFTNLVSNGEVDLSSLTTEAADGATQISKTLADMLAKAKDSGQPLRIDFDNNISVIIRISGNGKISADFLPSSQVAEAYLKENLPLLKQRFDENNLDYESLNRRERREQEKDSNRKKGRDNE